MDVFSSSSEVRETLTMLDSLQRANLFTVPKLQDRKPSNSECIPLHHQRHLDSVFKSVWKKLVFVIFCICLTYGATLTLRFDSKRKICSRYMKKASSASALQEYRSDTST